ncbi:hypothetical protein QBC35DRAFT_491568 [Podospora australis]|uniref:HIT-type domain-containing protein n=1 Tax=Podospora australis TaxID=1536484 RepID=A0AAN7AJY1_9PEZI|nr:hypothetical protein QBC35DRAFT_491568 [Podospora australis]
MSLHQGASPTGAEASTTSDSRPQSPPTLATQPGNEPSIEPAPALASDQQLDPQPVAKRSSPEPESPPPKRRKPDPKVCGVCETQPGKYKCPRCTMPYCSVTCNKVHKENHPPDPVPEKPPSADEAKQPAANEPDNDPFKVLLDHTHVFEDLFKRYPTLNTALERITATTLPPSTSENNKSGVASRFGSQFPGSKQNRQQPWTKDVGLHKGAAALRKARTDPSETGDGVRQFCDTVLYLLSTVSKKQNGEIAAEAVAKVKEEVTREERSVIERLMREEAGPGDL